MAESIVVLTVDQLEDIVVDAVAEGIKVALSQQVPRPRLMTATDIGEALQISRSKLDTLIREGLPYIRVGSTARFEFETVRQWLLEEHKPG